MKLKKVMKFILVALTIAAVGATASNADISQAAIIRNKKVEVPAGHKDSTRKGKYVIAIDAGHQAKGNSALEPIGPGADTKKAKVAGGTAGRYSKTPEYKVTLQVAKKLEGVLEDRGYIVVMVREKNNVDISNAERAEIANKNKADLFIRLHCNGSTDSSVKGALTMCQTKKNPYNGNLYSKSRKLSDAILDELCKETKAKKRSVIETDTMSGINWCKTPVTIVEMGFMTNQSEDKLLNTNSYQNKLANGIANGIDLYFKK